VLTFSFFTAVFLSISWLIYMGTYIHTRLSGVFPSALGLTDLAVYAALVIIPLFVIWMMWNAIYRFRHEKNLQKQFKNIEAQLKQNQEFFEIAARLLYQGQQSKENHFVLNQTELFVNELNGLLADMLQRYRFIGEAEAAKLWSTTEKGNKWGFAKALIELQNSGTDFENRLYRTAVKENLLRGTINEFCARYARLLDLLKAHDQEKIFLNIIETGAFGKAFAILAPLSDRLQQAAPAATAADREPELFADAEMRIAPAAVEMSDEKEPETEADPLADLEELNLSDIFGSEEKSDNETVWNISAEETVADNSQAESAWEEILPATDEKQETTAEEPLAEEAPIVKEEAEKTTADADIDNEISRMFAGAGVRGEDEEDEESADKHNNKASRFPKFSNLFKRKPVKEKISLPENEIDPLTLALERSFGKLSDDAQNKDSRLYRMMSENSAAGSEKESGQEKKFAFASTNETIMKLQQELEALKTPAGTQTEKETDKNGEKQNL